jgi:hypothetical protein
VDDEPCDDDGPSFERGTDEVVDMDAERHDAEDKELGDGPTGYVTDEIDIYRTTDKE